MYDLKRHGGCGQEVGPSRWSGKESACTARRRWSCSCSPWRTAWGREAAELAGVSRRCGRLWAAGRLPHSFTGAPRRGARIMGGDRSDARAGGALAQGAYEPPASGPLSGLTPDQIESLLLRAVLADLKAGGWDPASISNRSKCELGERLRRETGLPLRSITAFLRISKSSYEYQRRRLGARRDPDADIRPLVKRLFAEGRGAWGYRPIWARLRRAGVRASEKRCLSHTKSCLIHGQKFL